LTGFQKAKTKGSLFLKILQKNPEIEVPEFSKFQKKNWNWRFFDFQIFEKPEPEVLNKQSNNRLHWLLLSR
jgi:hypothetical protein